MVLVAVGQICSTASLTHNLAQCQNLVRRAAAAGAKALFLPEASDYIANSASESLALAQPLHTSPFVLGLLASAKQYSMAINVGVHEPSTTPSPITTSATPSPTNRAPKLLNTLIHISASGEITQRYDKIHLFDIDLSASKGPVLQESESVVAGRSLTAPFALLASTPGLRVGLQICFDVRFGRAASALRAQGATVLVFPSAFTVATGRAGHWETLLRARALDTQCWVVAAAQAGRHGDSRCSWGQSLVVDPWGEVRGRLSSWDDIARREGEGRPCVAVEPELWVGEIDGGLVESVRRDMPLIAREDVYG